MSCDFKITIVGSELQSIVKCKFEKLHCHKMSCDKRFGCITLHQCKRKPLKYATDIEMSNGSME